MKQNPFIPFDRYIREKNFIDIKEGKIANVQNYFEGTELLHPSKHLVVSGPRQCGKTLMAINYAIYLLENTMNSKIFFLSERYVSAQHIREKMSQMIGQEHHLSNGFKNKTTNSEIVFSNSLIGSKPTHVIVDNVEFCSKDFLRKNFILQNSGKEPFSVKIDDFLEAQIILTCLSGFGFFLEQENIVTIFKPYPLTKQEAADFTILDNTKKIENEILEKMVELSREKRIDLEDCVDILLKKIGSKKHIPRGITHDKVVGYAYNKVFNKKTSIRNVFRTREEDAYYSGFIDCFEWLTELSQTKK